MTLHCVRRRRTQSILQGKTTNFVYAATEVEALYARFSKFLWLVTYLCHFYRHFEFICTLHHHARIHCHEVNCSLSFPVDFGCCFFCLVKLSCRMFKGFVASICHSLRTFCNTTRTRRNDIFGVEFMGRNLSLSAHFISSLCKCLSSCCCLIYNNKPTFYCLQPNK